MWSFTKSNYREGIIETGLKAIDLLVPLHIGDDILLSGEAKSGAKVFGNELAYRLMKLPVGGFRVFILLDSALDDLEIRASELQEVMPNSQDIFIRSAVTATDIRELRSQRTSHNQDAFFCISESERFIDLFRQSMHAERTESSGTKGLTSCVVTEAKHAVKYEAKIISSRAIAQEGVYPALDVRLSSPSQIAAQAMPASQRRVCHSLIDSLKHLLEDFSPGQLRDPNWKFNSDPSLRPTVQALRFLSQPYFTAESYTGLKAAFVPVKHTTQSFKWILDGKFRDASPSLFVFKNELPDF